MKKTEVYSWRVSPDLKERLEDAARAEDMSLAGLLEQISLEWLEDHLQVDGDEQRRLHEAAREWMGTVVTGEVDLAERASERVREIIWEKHARKRSN